MVEILYQDTEIVVCVKPAGVISQDGGEHSLPDILRKQLGCEYVGVVHRLDKEASGVMVYALNQKAAGRLSKSMQNGMFEKRYLAVLSGCPTECNSILEDLLFHDKARNKTFVVSRMRGGVKPAKLEYVLLESKGDLSLVDVGLHTGRTHQIRVQFSSRKLPLVGDRKYGGTSGSLGLWSYRLAFSHPVTGTYMTFKHLPVREEPWSLFSKMEELCENG